MSNKEALVLVRTEKVDLLIQEHQAFMTRTLQVIEGYEVDEEELDALAEMMVAIKRRMDALEAARKEAVGPADKQVRATNARVKTVRDRLDGLQRQLKKLYADYEVRRRQAEAEALAALAAAEVDEEDEEAVAEAEEALVQAVAAVPEPPKHSNVRMPEVVDRDAIQAAVDAGVREIEGVRIFQVWCFEVEDAKAVPAKYKKLQPAVSGRR